MFQVGVTHEAGDVWVIGVSGVLAPDAEEEIQSAFDSIPLEAAAIVMDLSRVEDVSAAGWGMLLGASQKTRALSGRLRIAGLDSETRRHLLDLCRTEHGPELHGSLEEALAVESVKEFPVPDSFGAWLWAKFKRVRLVPIPTLGISLSVVGAITSLMRVVNEPWFMPATFGTQLIMIVLLTLVMPRPPSNTYVSERASRAAEQFHEAWHSLWLFWVVLYALLTLRSTLVAAGGDEEAWWRMRESWQPVTNLANNLQTAAFTIAYLVVSKETVRPERAGQPLPWRPATAVVILVLFVEIGLAVLAPTSSMGVEATRQHWAAQALRFLQWFSGIAAGVAMALLIGRLDSKFINAPATVLGMLYFYALIQPTWGGFEKQEIEMVFISLALALKCLFFLFVYWLYESGTMLFYLERVGRVYTTGEAMRTAFLRRFWTAEKHPELFRR